MAVARNQIDEIHTAIVRWMRPVYIPWFLVELTQTVAYKKNKSFHDTIDRLCQIQASNPPVKMTLHYGKK